MDNVEFRIAVTVNGSLCEPDVTALLAELRQTAARTHTVISISLVDGGRGQERESQNHPIFDAPIEQVVDFGDGYCSGRIREALRQLEIHTLRDLGFLTPADTHSVRNFGAVSLGLLEDKVREFDVKIGDRLGRK